MSAVSKHKSNQLGRLTRHLLSTESRYSSFSTLALDHHAQAKASGSLWSLCVHVALSARQHKESRPMVFVACVRSRAAHDCFPPGSPLVQCYMTDGPALLPGQTTGESTSATRCVHVARSDGVPRLLNMILKKVGDVRASCIVIDSISLLVALHGVAGVAPLVLGLRQHGVSLLTTLQVDMLRGQASTFVSSLETLFDVVVRRDGQSLLHTRVMRRNPDTLRTSVTTEVWTSSAGGLLMAAPVDDYRYYAAAEKPRQRAPLNLHSEKTNRPFLTTELPSQEHENLSAKQREQRARVALPYAHKGAAPGQKVHSSLSSFISNVTDSSRAWEQKRVARTDTKDCDAESESEGSDLDADLDQ